jgi:hypothetical protein
MIAFNRDPDVCDGSQGEHALQLQFQSLLLSLRTLYFATASGECPVLPAEHSLLAQLHAVGQQLASANPDNWTP